jgi:hypothetical protein
MCRLLHLAKLPVSPSCSELRSAVFCSSGAASGTGVVKRRCFGVVEKRSVTRGCLT